MAAFVEEAIDEAVRWLREEGRRGLSEAAREELKGGQPAK